MRHGWIADMQQKTVPNVGRFGCLGKKLRVKRKLTRWLAVTIRFERRKCPRYDAFGNGPSADKLNIRENTPLAAFALNGRLAGP